MFHASADPTEANSTSARADLQAIGAVWSKPLRQARTSCGSLLMQVIKHVFNDGKHDTHATRIVLRSLEYLRSLRLDTILAGANKNAKRGSRTETDVAEKPSDWSKVSIGAVCRVRFILPLQSSHTTEHLCLHRLHPSLHPLSTSHSGVLARCGLPGGRSRGAQVRGALHRAAVRRAVVRAAAQRVHHRRH